MAVLTWPKAAEGRKASNRGNQSDSIDTPPLAPHIPQLPEDTNGIKTDTALTMYYI